MFGEVLSGKSIVRKIENMPTQPGDKPSKEVTITDCGELTGEEAEMATQKAPDSTGDPYEDFPEDNNDSPTAKEIMEIATNLKGYGNTAFKAGNLALGLEKYQKGLRYLNEDPDLKIEPAETKKTLDALRFTLNSNSALLANKLKDFPEGLRSAEAALAVKGISDAEKAKALFRAAVAQIGLKEDDAALKNLEEADRLVPNDAAVVKELKAIKKAAADRAKKEKALYSKAFA